jgi:uncharacterized protein
MSIGELVSMQVEIVETSGISFKSPIVVEGLPGVGLVGTIAATYLVDKLKMEPAGYLMSDAFPPIAAIHNSVPLHPARIYASPENRLVVILSEFIIPLAAIYPLSREILAWSRRKGAESIISLGGISIKGEQDEVFGIASTPETLGRLSAAGVKPIKEGATTGVNGVLLAECSATRFPAVSLLAEAKQEAMDPMGAVMVIEALKKLTGLRIDTTDLLRESKELESKMSEMMSKARDAGRRYKEAAELESMYG